MSEGAQTQRIVEVDLPNGSTGLIQVRELDGGGATKVSSEERFNFGDVTTTLEGISEALRTSLAKARPANVSVTLGVELTVKSGKLTALIIEGGGKATLSVTLEWAGTP
jgi:Trypsin-co-occurring domain 1